MTVPNMMLGEVRDLDTQRLIVPDPRSTLEKLLARLAQAEEGVD